MLRAMSRKMTALCAAIAVSGAAGAANAADLDVYDGAVYGSDEPYEYVETRRVETRRIVRDDYIRDDPYWIGERRRVTVLLGDSGYSDWDDLDWDDGAWVIEDARAADGERYDLRVDPRSHDVVRVVLN
jgi:hypothetical protein